MHLVITPPSAGLAPQRMDKTGVFTPSSPGVRQKVTGWTGDATNDEIVIGGAGQTRIVGTVTESGLGNGTVYLVLNGTDIASAAMNTGNAITLDGGTRTVTAGDRIWLEQSRGNSTTRGVGPGTYVEHTPT